MRSWITGAGVARLRELPSQHSCELHTSFRGQSVMTPIDVHNGLLLSALWDAAFDHGLVSFADDGTPVLSPQLTEPARIALGIENGRPLHGLRPAHRENLAIHRTRHGF